MLLMTLRIQSSVSPSPKESTRDQNPQSDRADNLAEITCNLSDILRTQAALKPVIVRVIGGQGVTP